jgi:hypothetical protein
VLGLYVLAFAYKKVEGEENDVCSRACILESIEGQQPDASAIADRRFSNEVYL